VLERKTVKEIKYPHKMYSPDGEEVTANNKEEHEKYSAKGYSHSKPVKEVDEPRAKGEKEFKAKHAIKKSGMNPDGTNVKEGKVVRLDEPDEIQTADEAELSPKQKKYQAFFQKALKKFGVKSPSELDGDKKKEFFDYVDKNYDAGEGEEDEYESKKPKKEEVTISIDTTLLETKKPGRGKTTQDIDYIGDKSHAKTAEKKHKIKIKVTGRSTADISGEKKNIIAYLKDPDLYGMDDLDIEDIYPELYK
jgi:hypothetical protein